MTLRELVVGNGIISQGTQIQISRKRPSLFLEGEWYEDDILRFMDEAVEYINWKKGSRLYVTLMDSDEGRP